MENRLAFVSKLSLVFVLYFSICTFFVYMIDTYKEQARELYLHARLEASLLFYIILMLSLKMMFSIFGFAVKKLALVVYLIDIYLSYQVILGIYFKLGRDKIYYSDDSHFVVVNIWVFFMSSIAFFLSSFKQTRDNSYDFIVGLIMMELSALATVKVF